MSSDLVAAILLAFVGGGGLAAVLVKFMSREVDDATAEEKMAGVRATDIDNLRSIIAELRASEARKDQRIDSLERRMALVEERERHALTRAAVHEAWDQMAFAMLVAQNPTHPPPPPLTPPGEIES